MCVCVSFPFPLSAWFNGQAITAAFNEMGFVQTIKHTNKAAAAACMGLLLRPPWAAGLAVHTSCREGIVTRSRSRPEAE